MKSVRPGREPKAPVLPVPKALMPHKSLQINIDSEDDAKAVIQNLQHIMEAWKTCQKNYGVESVEFCIAADIRREVDTILTGAVRWCRTYIKQVTPFDGNVLYPLPHYKEPAPSQPVVAASEVPIIPSPAQPVIPQPEALGKSKRPVRAAQATA